VTPPPEKAPLAAAMEWVSRITTVAIEMVLPGMMGYGLDRYFGTSFFVLVGFALGMVLGFWHLLRMTQAASDREQNDQAKDASRQSKKTRRQ
jgi:F0F1-type ATP synthase assembly protein I